VALKWAFKKALPFDPSEFIKENREKENPDVIDFICNSHIFSEEDINLMIIHDKPLLLAGALSTQGRPWTHDLTIKALQAGAWNVLKWAHTIDQFKSFFCPEILGACLQNLPGRAIPMLDPVDEEEKKPKMPPQVRKWVQLYGTPTSFDAFYAAKMGRLDVLKWFFPEAKGCGEKVWSTALHHDHLEILVWLHRSRPENPSFDKEILIRRANKLGRSDIVGLLTVQ
jgi:hypothetical protein